MMLIIQNETFLQLKNACRNYGSTLVDITLRAILLVTGTAVLNTLVLYFYSILWHIYRLTYIGRQFVILHPKQTLLISSVVGNDIAHLSTHTTLAAFAICMIISALCQVFYISRFFYDPQGLIGKLALWGLPLTAIVSIFMNAQLGFKDWTAVIPITIVPTLCVFTYSFKFSAQLLPEIGEVIKAIFRFFKFLFHLLLRQAMRSDPGGSRRS
jgi:hypothetical protein